MSSAVRAPFSRASFSAFTAAASGRGWLRWVPVTVTLRASAMKSGSTSSSQSAMSAQFSR